MKHIALLSVLWSFSSLHSQDIEDHSLKHSIKQDGMSVSFTVLDPDKKGISRYRDDKTYYWYKSQKVMGTQGGSSGQLLHGKYESFYANKQLNAKGLYEKGLKNGEWQYWRADGTLIKAENWKCGAKCGEQLDYAADGSLIRRTVIRGKSERIEAGDTLTEISGTSRKITLKDSIGEVRSIARYRNNRLHGRQETVGADGSRTVTEYKNGTLVEEKAKEPKPDKTDPSSDNEPGFFQRLKTKLFPKKAGEQDASADSKKTGKEKKPASDKKKAETPKEPKASKKANETPATEPRKPSKKKA